MRIPLGGITCQHLIHYPDRPAAGFCSDCGVQGCEKCITRCESVRAEESVFEMDGQSFSVTLLDPPCGKLVCRACLPEHECSAVIAKPAGREIPKIRKSGAA